MQARHDADFTSESNNFKNWFGNSKVVDNNKQPLIVYHGSSKSFDAFEHGHERQHPMLGGDDNGIGFFFTADPGRRSDSGRWSGASGYAGVSQRDGETLARDGANLVPVYLSIQLPFVEKDLASYLDNVGKGDYRDKLETLGYDGVKVGDTFIAFHASQVKSAIGNSGLYDANNPDITDRVDRAQRAKDWLDAWTTSPKTKLSGNI